MDPIKLQKYFTDCGILSRRTAEEKIRQGLVRVNGKTAALGMRIDPERDTVEYQNTVLRPTDREKICIMLNKPRGFLSTLCDDRNRKTVADLVSSLGRRVYPIGRLDMDSDGLLLLTDDGDLSYRLTHPRHEIPKIYQVWVGGTVDDRTLRSLQSPLVIDGYRTLPVGVRQLGTDDASGTTVLQMRLFEGRNRQIRKMCAMHGLTVRRLCRTAVGELRLGDLPPGHWRKLTPNELAYLRGERKSLRE